MESNVYKTKQHPNLFIFLQSEQQQQNILIKCLQTQTIPTFVILYSQNITQQMQSNVYKPKLHLHFICLIYFSLKKTLKKVCNVTQTFFVCSFVCCTDYKELNLKSNPNNIFDIF